MDLINNKDDQKKVLTQLRTAANFFYDNFIGKKVKFTYFKGKKNFRTVYIKFSPNNFQHLVGIKYDLGAATFWEHVFEGNVSWKAVKLTSWSRTRPNIKKGDTRTNFEKKLNAMSSLPDILSEKARILEEGTLNNVRFDHLIRTNRQTIGLATASRGSEQEFFISTMDLTGLFGTGLRGFVIDEITAYNRDGSVHTSHFKRDVDVEKAKSQIKKRNRNRNK